MIRFAAWWMLALVLLASAAEASGPGLTAITKWKTMDACARQAQTAHPDFTPQSNAQRNAQLNACLNANNLPPRLPQSPPPQH
ncbi:MAG: hypothetical protein ACREE2_07110 [Stellaceae bacterium]